MFCPTCKSLMYPEEGVFKCRKCETAQDMDPSSQGQTVVETSTEKEMVVIEGDMDLLPKTRVHCANCGNNEAYWVIRQTRAADEPETRIYRCTKCSHSWREY